jgi:hypothetical protein
MISPFIHAHGYVPGPAGRPIAAGAVTGVLAVVPFLIIAWLGGGLSEVTQRMGVSAALVPTVYAMLMVAGGALYGWLFMRAANDRCGGWLFGISYGFVTWMLGPATILPVVTGRPVVVGAAAQFFFAAHVAYGLTLGLLYPYSDSAVRRKAAPFTRIHEGVSARAESR